MSDKRFRLRVALLVGVPLLLAAVAGVIQSPRWSTLLYYGAIVALGVMLIESLVEVRRYRKQIDQGLEESKAAKQLHERLAQKEQKVAEQELELAEATNDRRLAELMRYIGENSPTLAEMSLMEPRTLDGWFCLVAKRVQKASTSGYAGIVLLREVVDWYSGDFVASYQVMYSGWSGDLGLDAKMLPATDNVETVLVNDENVGSAYVSEFSLDDQRYWVCVLLSTTARHSYLDTVSRALVAPILAALVPNPPEPQQPQIKEEPPEQRESNS